MRMWEEDLRWCAIGHQWEEDLRWCAIGHHKGNGSWGSYQKSDALCGRTRCPGFPCPWPQSVGDQISQLIALIGIVLTWLQIWVVGCTSVFALQDAGVVEASEAIRGQHPSPALAVHHNRVS